MSNKRFGCFETFSSINHVLIMPKEYSEKWKHDGHLYIYTGKGQECSSAFEELSAEEWPVHTTLYTEEEAFAFIEKGSGRTKKEILDGLNEDDAANILHYDFGFDTYEMWNKDGRHDSTYEYVTPSGECIIIYASFYCD